MVGSFGVGELTPRVMSVAGVAGWVGRVLDAVAELGAVGGGVLVAAGPASGVCAGAVVEAVGAVVVAVGVVLIDGSG